VSFDEIESLLRDIAPRRKLLHDTALAARTNPAVEQSRSTQQAPVFLDEGGRDIYGGLARLTGLIVFSASHAGEMAVESSKIQNGFFTHEILEALGSEEADRNLDGRISVDELEAFAPPSIHKSWHKPISLSGPASVGRHDTGAGYGCSQPTRPGTAASFSIYEDGPSF
jgi:hypothetical protein